MSHERPSPWNTPRALTPCGRPLTVGASSPRGVPNDPQVALRQGVHRGVPLEGEPARPSPISSVCLGGNPHARIRRLAGGAVCDVSLPAADRTPQPCRSGTHLAMPSPTWGISGVVAAVGGPPGAHGSHQHNVALGCPRFPSHGGRFNHRDGQLPRWPSSRLAGVRSGGAPQVGNANLARRSQGGERL